ncbi:MAG: class I SAM-dependent methyltransferase [Bacteroidales bacterium]|nr:class I SAM-dependent methyltransferase [Bacteroidales bacterium]
MWHWFKWFGTSAAFLKYWLKTGHKKDYGVHSPFVYGFIASVLSDKVRYNAYDIAETYRYSLKKDKTLIRLTDFGAGSRAGRAQERTVADIASLASVSRKSGRLLFRIAQYYKPDLIIELGTSLGISTHYLASGNPDARVITIEADPAVATLASAALQHHNLMNVSVIIDTFENALPWILTEIRGKTLVFIDGNHQFSSTLSYASSFLSRLPDGSILVFDDINWSEGMRQAWKEIRGNKKATLVIDLFYMGIVFIKHDFFPENYTIRF